MNYASAAGQAAKASWDGEDVRSGGLIGGATQREGEVPQQLMRLEKTLSELESTLSMLFERLRPILRDGPETSNAIGMAPEQVISTPLANAIASQRMHASVIATKVARMLQAIEL